MSGAIGVVSAGLQMYAGSKINPRKRGFYSITDPYGKVLEDIKADICIEEHHSDEVEITQHPVAQGASIADHMFKRPSQVTVRLGWSDSPTEDASLLSAAIGAAAAVSPLAATLTTVASIGDTISSVQSILNGGGASQIVAKYEAMMQLQIQRCLFTLYTGKRTYFNMVAKSISVETTAESENSLMMVVVCQEVLMAKAVSVAISKADAKTASDNASIVSSGPQTPQPASPSGAPVK